MFDRALNAPLVVPVNELLNKHVQKTLYSRQKLPPDFLPTFIQGPVTYLSKFKVLAIITKVKQIELYLEENRA